jgi:hypothetical protein
MTCNIHGECFECRSDNARSEKREWEKRARRAMNLTARMLKAEGFEVSPVRFNPGGVAVWGEASFRARRPGDRIGAYLQAHRYRDEDAIMYRAEEWPTGEHRHHRMGPNRETKFAMAGLALACAIGMAIDHDEERMS